MSSNLSGSSTLEFEEEIEKRTVKNGDQEDIDRHPAPISSATKFISKLELPPWLDGMQLVKR